MPKPERHVFVCTQQRPPGHPRPSCGANHGSFSLYAALSMELDQRGLFQKVQVTSTGCMGPCHRGPSVLVYPEGVMYAGMQESDLPAFIEEHLVGGKPVASLLMPQEDWG
ncbi:MAG: (2Fe-2S) ferredoxin domain-containing protein [Gammaproteobacteria bacterium]|nr:(2Fe-2S) ferredoxin domain-containing protein [Gammaproteobacteria bacterium]MBU1725593.1 (2Fe-2S) ferredoxin domain-containing protein [Gammaproteobacteria bacterium]MBU2005500.1 (2Fe-2S) ferredoxin domain-containing protein [Gammaproteobacteria bacterium]